jgi:DNA-binding XRE family transcriptional regulator
MEDKDITIPDVDVEMVVRLLGYTSEQAQLFIDIGVARGIVVPIENGKYRAVSEITIQRAKELIKQTEELRELYEKKLGGGMKYE